MKSHNYFCYVIFVFTAMTVLSIFTSPCNGATTQTLYDPDGYLYDIYTGAGTYISGGTSDAYDGAYYLRINGVNYNATDLTVSGRNIIGTVETLSGLQVARKFYVPDSKSGALGNFGRWYDSLYNPTESPITVSVEYYGNLGSDTSTVVTNTSDGDTTVEITDQWIATDDSTNGGGDPSLAHQIYVLGALEAIDYINRSTDNITWTYQNVVIQPGQVIGFLTFAIQETNNSSSWEEAGGIIGSLTSHDLNSVALRGLTQEEYESLVNIPVEISALKIRPWNNLNSVGPQGGPFDPNHKIYSLTNNGDTLLDWGAAAPCSWVSIDPNGGTLLPGEFNSVDVEIYINEEAKSLSRGIHTCEITFTNIDTGKEYSRNVELCVGPKKILVYTQYVNQTAPEYTNVLAALDKYSDNCYTLDMLTSYLNLDSMLPGHDVFLIPEPNSSVAPSTLEVIGAFWKNTLQNWVDNGGIVVHCDGSDQYGILTGAELMNISLGDFCSYNNVDVVAPNDSIAEGVSSPYIAQPDSRYYSDGDETMVVEYAGYGAVVIHKLFGMGHVILIGHDYSYTNEDQDLIVGNAVFNIDNMVAYPAEGFSPVGNEEGPFTPWQKSYTVANNGPDKIEWEANITPLENWLTVNPSGGILSPDENEPNVVVSLTDDVYALWPGMYECNVIFRNLDSGNEQVRKVILEVNDVRGEIEVTDSIPGPNILFGNVIVGLTRSAEVTITNVDPNPRHEVTVEDIYIGGGSYTEDFSDSQAQDWQADLPAYWGFYSQRYRVDAYLYNFSGYTQSMYTGKTWKNATVEITADCTYYSSSYGRSYNYAGVVLRANDSFDIRSGIGSAYIIFIRGNQYFKVTKYINGVSTDIVDWTYSSQLNYGDYDNTVKAVIDDSTIQVYLNPSIYPNPVWTGTDSDIPGPGHIGLVAYRLSTSSYYNTYFDFDNVSVLADNVFSLSLPSNGPPWTLDGGDSMVVDVNFVPTDITYYESDLVIESNDLNNPVIRLVVSGTGILDYLQIVPDANFEFSGLVGGPFSPWNTSYELYNGGSTNIDWVVEPNVPWLDVSPTGSTLVPYESILVTVMPNALAESLPEGYYCGDVIFTNTTTTVTQKRRVCLDINSKYKIWISPQYFDVTLAYGQTQTKTLTIGNTGSAPVNFSLSSRQTNFSPPAEQALASASEAVVSAPEGHDFTVAATGASYTAGELLVRFAPCEDGTWPGFAEKNAILSSLGSATIEREYRIVPGLCLVKLPVNVTVTDALVSFNNTVGILYAESDYELQLVSDCQNIPNDPRFGELWGMIKIQAPEAWCIHTDASGIIVAVTDSGVNYTHPDLAANMWVNETEYNGALCVDDDDNGYVDDIYGYDFYNSDSNPLDDNGHGTHVSGTIGAMGNNSEGVVGVCWGVKTMALKCFSSSGFGLLSAEIAAIEYAVDNGAKVINASWSGSAYNQGLRDAIEAANDTGIIFVAAASNYSNQPWYDNDVTPVYPANYTIDNIISVMSTDSSDARSSFSHYGATSVDLGAPGSNILSTWPPSCSPYVSYHTISGTSMATPHVAGACALVWSACPSLSHLDVKDIILGTVDPLPDINGLCVTGGRLNLYNALQQAVADGAEPNAIWLELDPNAGAVAPASTNDINVIFDANQPPGTYEGYIVISTEDACDIEIPVRMTVEPSDYFTELFEADYFEPNSPNCNDMANRSVIFVPDGSGNYFSVCSSGATYFPVDPNGGTIVSLRDDDYEPVILQSHDVNFYGTDYDTFFISSNGYITFVSPDISCAESLVVHFGLPRISPLFDDLDPSAGGTISWKQLSDRIAVTFENVPEYSLSNSNSFQVELFFDGTIRITWLDIDCLDGLVGLSEGMGLPADFVESDLSEYRFSCDFDGDCNVDFSDFAVFGSHWLADCNAQNNWCDGVDLEPNGYVNWKDLDEFALNWLIGSP